MAFAEDLAPFFDVASGFAVAATLDGVGVEVIPDDETLEALGGGMLTQEPAVLLPTSAASAAAADQAVVLDAGDLPAHLVQLAGNYIVRRVEKVPPDAALTRLVLAKT